MWTVVLFEKENTVAVVPQCWLMQNNKICCWPPVHDFKKLVMNCKSPEGSWQIFGVRVLGHVYGDYLKARNAARLAEETSDINSDPDSGKRKKKLKVVSEDDLSSSEFSDCNENNECQRKSFPALPERRNFVRNSSPQLHTELPRSVQDVEENRANSSNSVSTASMISSKLGNENYMLSEELLSRLIKQQSLINFKLSNLQHDVTTIMDRLSSTSDSESAGEFQYDGILAKNLEDLKRFDNFLKLEDNSKKFVMFYLHLLYYYLLNELQVTFVKKIGGTSPYECVKRVLIRIMSDEVASKMCWNGSKTKHAFVGMIIQKCLITGIQANPSIKNEKQIEEAVKSWLRHAKARLQKASDEK